MSKKRYSAEKNIGPLPSAEILISECKTIIEAARHLGVSQQNYYGRGKEYGGMEVAQINRLKELEQENSRLNHLMDGQVLGSLILNEGVPSETSKPPLRREAVGHVGVNLALSERMPWRGRW